MHGQDPVRAPSRTSPLGGNLAIRNHFRLLGLSRSILSPWLCLQPWTTAASSLSGPAHSLSYTRARCCVRCFESAVITNLHNLAMGLVPSIPPTVSRPRTRMQAAGQRRHYQSSTFNLFYTFVHLSHACIIPSCRYSVSLPSSLSAFLLVISLTGCALASGKTQHLPASHPHNSAIDI